MPSPSSPRVNVVVSPQQHHYLMTLARYQNRSAASLVREMIDAAEPLMKRTVGLLELTQSAQDLTKDAALQAIKAVLDEMRQLAGDTDQLDLLKLLSGDTDAELAGAPAAASEEAPANPPSSNTGVSSAGPSASGAVSRRRK